MELELNAALDEDADVEVLRCADDLRSLGADQRSRQLTVEHRGDGERRHSLPDVLTERAEDLLGEEAVERLRNFVGFALDLGRRNPGQADHRRPAVGERYPEAEGELRPTRTSAASCVSIASAVWLISRTSP